MKSKGTWLLVILALACILGAVLTSSWVRWLSIAGSIASILGFILSLCSRSQAWSRGHSDVTQAAAVNIAEASWFRRLFQFGLFFNKLKAGRGRFVGQFSLGVNVLTSNDDPRSKKSGTAAKEDRESARRD